MNSWNAGKEPRGTGWRNLPAPKYSGVPGWSWEGAPQCPGLSIERGLYNGHGNEGVSDRGPRGYPLTLGTCLAMPFHIPLHPLPVKPC